MVELPSGIGTTVPEDARPAVERWWASLADAQRQELAGLWDERREVQFFGKRSAEPVHSSGMRPEVRNGTAGCPARARRRGRDEGRSGAAGRWGQTRRPDAGCDSAGRNDRSGGSREEGAGHGASDQPVSGAGPAAASAAARWPAAQRSGNSSPRRSAGHVGRRASTSLR